MCLVQWANAVNLVCRIQLGELLASALPVPETLPITKPLLPSHASLSSLLSSSQPTGLPTTALPSSREPLTTKGGVMPLEHRLSPDRAAGVGLVHVGALATADAVEGACMSGRGEGDAVQGHALALRGAAPAVYTTLQAVSILTHSITLASIRNMNFIQPSCCTHTPCSSQLAC